MVSANRILEEDQIVAELAVLGVNYLSQTSQIAIENPRPADQLLARLICQPSGRVRGATIALLLAHPEYSQSIPLALNKIRPAERLLLKLFYTAAMLLQQLHYKTLQDLLQDDFQPLPDLFSVELCVPEFDNPGARLKELGYQHQILTGKIANWSGTYQQAASHFLRRKAMETAWKR